MPSKCDNSSTASKPRHLYEYAVFRFLPKVERGEFVNIGLIMMCKRRKWIRVGFELNKEKLVAFGAGDSLAMLESQTNGIQKVASGTNDSGPMGQLEPHERFRWLTAVRSASIRTSPPHAGMTDSLDETFDRLFAELVL